MSVRRYCAAQPEHVDALAEGREVILSSITPASDDEEVEFEALHEAAGSGRVVVTAVTASLGDAFGLDAVESFHLDVDGSGHLSWYAPTEIDVVRSIVSQQRD